ncbi:hypothetical protein BGZ58_007663 [Dissophora ornata]|nr:hypothetical protein BGZ58_007663 [Dissophora ornata]
MLSPVPASVAQAQASTSSAITLYPVESVPSHLLCAICTLPYENPVHFLPCCHVFCLECIQLWIGMNLGDDLLQNELRRAYPAEGEVVPAASTELLSGYEDMSQLGYQSRQQLMFELARMGDSRSQSGVSNFANNLYDSFNHLTPAQRQHLQQQQNQQRVAVLLQSREMPKCPMCRTGLHINGWDRIEEQIKVPVTVSSRPRPSNNTTTASPSSSSEWLERGGMIQGQRPVSGVERRRVRPDRFASNSGSRRREEVIGEEEEEEIEMEQVRTTRSRSNINTLSPYPSSSSPPTQGSRQHGRSDRTYPRYMDQPTVQTDRRLLRQGRLDGNDDEEIQSPTTAVIGRRPSEWMRYQQRQLQAHQEQLQSNRLQANEAAAGVSDQSDTPHPHAVVEDRYTDQQEQIRRLYLEQESQEELLRTLTARAASIIEAEEESRRQESDSSSPGFATTVENTGTRNSLNEHTTPQNQSDDQEERSDEIENGSERVQALQSTLQIDTSLSRSSSRQSHGSQNASNHSRSRENMHNNEEAGQVVLEQGSAQLEESSGNNTGADASDSDDNNSIINSIQQGTRAWAERPSSLRHGLDGSEESLELSLDDVEGDLSVSDSVTNSARPSFGSHSPSLLLSPSNESTLSIETSSTFSQSIQTHSSIDTPFSQRSSIQPQWERHSLSLRMPILETDHTQQHWIDQNVEDEDQANCYKAVPSTVMSVDSGMLPSSSSASTKEKSGVEQGDITKERAATPAPNVWDNDLSSGSSVQGSSSGATLDTNLVSSSSSVWKAGTSISPLIRDLDIHSPIVIAEGSMTTIADMQIDAGILARARSHSVALSDEDFRGSAIRERPSPVDSPIPTPSTARPRNRFPAGISLAGEDDDEEEDVDDDASEANNPHPELEQDEAPGTPDSLSVEAEVMDQTAVAPSESPNAHGSREEEGAPIDSIDANIPTEDISGQSIAAAVAPSTAREESTEPIRDPLSAAISSSESTPTILGSVDIAQQERGQVTSSVSSVRPRRATMSSPPPLPLPLPVTVEEQGILRAAPMATTNGSARAEEDRGMTSLEDIRPMPIGSSNLRNSGVQGFDVEPTTSPAPYSGPISTTGSAPSASQEPQEEQPPAVRVQEHIQYRTLVRYQPRLPKAHVMSDLISQIQVECPHKEFGCHETVEMQKALQHGRDQCQFRQVMCPRPQCGLWMRADQIVDHVVMVEMTSGSSSSNGNSTSSSSASSPSSSDPPSISSVRVVGCAAGLSPQKRQNNGVRAQQRPLRGQRSQSGGGSSSLPKKQQQQAPQTLSETTTRTTGPPSPSLNTRACAGLTWDREQLARATGIIGQLTEENSSLRQTVRQLTLRNSELMKDKDRWQRYANIGLRRD